MTTTITIFKHQVDQLFQEAVQPHGCLGRNPVTENSFVWGVDPIKPQKERAERALNARAHFRFTGPSGFELPLNYREREAMKCRGPQAFMVYLYAFSLYSNEFDVGGHPSFETFASGVMAAADTDPYLSHIRHVPELRRLYLPRCLPGLGQCAVWRPVQKKSLSVKGNRRGKRDGR